MNRVQKLIERRKLLKEKLRELGNRLRILDRNQDSDSGVKKPLGTIDKTH